MPRYRQDPVTLELIQIDGDEPRSGNGSFVYRDVDPFRSPIDGSIIRTRRQYQDHCKKHNVVPAAEFSKEFMERKAEERAKFFRGEHSRQEKLARKREIYEIMMRAERNGS